jgi:hypothetical protein
LSEALEVTTGVIVGLRKRKDKKDKAEFPINNRSCQTNREGVSTAFVSSKGSTRHHVHVMLSYTDIKTQNPRWILISHPTSSCATANEIHSN